MESHLILVFISTVLVTAVLGQGVHLELKGTVILNNSVVEYSDLGTNTVTLRCVTERVDCCSEDNSTIADWFTPSGEVADTQFRRSWSGVGSAEGYVYILRKSSTSVTSVQEGLYHCNIPAPNDDISTLYVGIYISDIGKPTISGITYNQLSPEMFTLTCTSTGGPATTVTWTLNGSEITYDANHVLTQTVVNTRTAEYNNTLTVTEREPGNYQCTVSNARGSDTSQLLVVNNTETTAPTPSSYSSSLIMEQLSTTLKPSTTTTPDSSTPSSGTTAPTPSSYSFSLIMEQLSTTLIPPTTTTPGSQSTPPTAAGTTAPTPSSYSSSLIMEQLSTTLIPPTTTIPGSQSTPPTAAVTPSATPSPSSSSQLPVAIAGAAAGLILVISLLAVLILVLVFKRRKSQVNKDKRSLQQIDNIRSPVNKHQTNPSTGQTLTSDDTIKNNIRSGVINTTSSHSDHYFDSSDLLYSALTDATTIGIDSQYSLVTEPPIPMVFIGPPTSSDQTVRKEGKTTQKKESAAADEPKTSFSPGDVYAVVQKKKDSPPPLPAPYQDELWN